MTSKHLYYLLFIMLLSHMKLLGRLILKVYTFKMNVFFFFYLSVKKLFF